MDEIKERPEELKEKSLMDIYNSFTEENRKQLNDLGKAVSKMYKEADEYQRAFMVLMFSDILR